MTKNRNCINSFCIFFDDEGNFQFSNLSFSSKPTKEQEKIIATLLNEIQGYIEKANMQVKKKQ